MNILVCEINVILRNTLGRAICIVRHNYHTNVSNGVIVTSS